MKNSKVSFNVAKQNQYSQLISDYEYRTEYSMLYVLDKVTKKTVYIIVDIESDNNGLLLSLVKCLISYKVKEKKVYYTCNELERKFPKKCRRDFTPKVEYEKRKSEEKENTISINHTLNFYPIHEITHLNIAS
jgi:hypothetical protein